MASKDKIVVYWAPWVDPERRISMDLLYSTPINVYKHLMSLRAPKNYHEDKKNSSHTQDFLMCPAVSNKLKQLYVVFNHADSDMEIVTDDDGVTSLKYLNEKTTNVPGTLTHQPTLSNHKIIEYGYSFAFFAEESLHVTVTSPYFQCAPHLEHGAVIPGSFDIGRWYRPINIEFNLWEGNNRLYLKEGEPLAYFEFHTDKEIVFKRYTISTQLTYIATSLIKFKFSVITKLLPRYVRFDKTGMRSLILKEIRANLVDDIE